MPRLARILLAAMLLAPLVAAPAAAGTVSCPNKLLVDGMLMRAGTGASGTARVDTQNRLLCLYPGLNLYATRAQPPGAPCVAVNLPLQVAGGTGLWRFGSPGSPATLVPPARPIEGGCAFGGPNYFVSTLVAWRDPPPGEVCTPSPRDGSSFDCGPAAAAIPGTVAAPAGIEATGSCPAQLRAETIPTTDWSEGAAKAGFFPPESFILNAETGRLVTPKASFKQVREAMGPAFARAFFLLSSAPNAVSGLPPGTYACTYEGPRVSRPGKPPLEATIAIACTGPCVLP